MMVWVRSMRSCYNETSVRYFDNRQFTNTMLDIKAFISLFHLWNGRPRLIIVFQVLGSCLSKTRDYVQFWFWWPQWVLGFVPICVFKKLKLVLAVLNSQNNGPVLLFKTIFRLWNDFSCCLFKLWMARMDMEWTTWKKIFLCLYAMPAEITLESLWLAIPVPSSGSSFLLLVT